MKVYIAASYKQRLRAVGARKILEAAGHEVTSRWLDGGGQIDPDRTDGWPKIALEWAGICRQDLDQAEAIVVIEPEASSTGGTMWEFGFAYARGLEIVVVGLPSNVFCYMVPCVRSVRQAATYLAGLEAEIVEQGQTG